ncbi:hypothetical protein H6G94_21170 [Nostoc punctiforme FACHB-252]|uniref:Uncharacterized protein n=1 Tax=Nostoc punctiforme FACHB-252 TaxID=1357509 RepID=A0ABR8HDB3_NOSPU|nr:hypothetical protein [Nostoc punctiforme]MBD2613759.1 hypothetical protein [Nostoc punctiforme FACHB-252]
MPKSLSIWYVESASQKDFMEAGMIPYSVNTTLLRLKQAAEGWQKFYQKYSQTQ